MKGPEIGDRVEILVNYDGLRSGYPDCSYPYAGEIYTVKKVRLTSDEPSWEMFFEEKAFPKPGKIGLTMYKHEFAVIGSVIEETLKELEKLENVFINNQNREQS